MTDEQNESYGTTPADQPPASGFGGPQSGPPPGYYGGPPLGAPPPGFYGGPQQSGPPPGYYGPPPGYPPAYYGNPRTNSKAGWALGLGIVGFFTCPLTGIAAVILGGQAKEEIRYTREQGEGMASAGVVLGWILCGLMALAVVGFLLVLVLAGARSGQ